MKLKARDIIPGWPRGRSTITCYSNDLWKYSRWNDYWFLIKRISADSLVDLKQDYNYHQKQQEMVNRFLTRKNRWLTPESHLELIVLFKEIWDNVGRSNSKGFQCVTWDDSEEERIE